MKQTLIPIGLLSVLLNVSSAADQWSWNCTQENTYGWQLMTPEERNEHQNRLQSFTEYDMCKEYIYEHLKKMDERAKDKGIEIPLTNINPCAAMRARGNLK